MSQPDEQLSFSIINTRMTVQSMRDSGYKSTTHALAELIDNSIESGATAIELFGVSRRDSSAHRRSTLKELAVLDNGCGMDETTLRGSLRYGHGTRQERRGIGRFGLGLPNSSLSQARRVDVWSWQAGVTNALHTRLSVDDVENGATEISKPELRSVPEVYLEASLNGFEECGTLVVWSDLDRAEWKLVSTTFRHTEFLLGRIYRRFLAKPTERCHSGNPQLDEIGDQRTITCIPVQDIDGSFEVQQDGIVEVRPNDPLYLMTGTSCPEKFGPGPMFQELESSPYFVSVPYEGKQYTVTIRASHARPHVRDSLHDDAQWPPEHQGKDAGGMEWGKHADRNLGVSMMRAHREIQLDESWVKGDDPRERWWTVEVDFPTALDEVFGVTNNKQGAVTFQRLAMYNLEREKLPGESPSDVRRRLEECGDRKVHLLDVKLQIERAIKPMRERVLQARQRRGPRHAFDVDRQSDATATAAIRRREEEGRFGQSDRLGESGTAEQHKETEIVSLRRHHFDLAEAVLRVEETKKAGNRVRLIESSQSSPAFFDVEPLPNVIQVALNTNHPVHKHLYELMFPESDDMSPEDLRIQLARAAAAFRVLIYSWARFEEEQNEKEQRRVRNVRHDWGKCAEEFFDDDDGTVPPTDSV